MGDDIGGGRVFGEEERPLAEEGSGHSVQADSVAFAVKNVGEEAVRTNGGAGH